MTPKDQSKVISKLESLKSAFANEAGRFQGYAATLSEAINELRADQQAQEAKAKQVKAENKVDSFLFGLSVLGKPLKDRNILLLIDGSASMQGLLGPAIDMAQTLNSAVKGMKDVNVKAWMYADDIFASLDFDNEKMMAEAKKSLNRGSDMLPTLRELNKFFDVLGPSRRETNIIIVGDGEVGDPEVSKQALGELMKKDANVTVDVLQLYEPRFQSRAYGSELFKAVELAVKENGLSPDRIALHSASADKPIEALTTALVQRAQKSTAPKASKKKGPKGPDLKTA